MKQWLETREVLDRLSELLKQGKRAALATVVRVRGSAYRHEGAKMLVAEDGSTVGNVSGGCLEADVKEVALQVLKSGTPEVRSWCAGSDEIAAWDLGVGCEGEVEVLIEVAAEAREHERALLDGTAPFAICVVRDVPGKRLVVTQGASHATLGNPKLDAAVVQLARGELRSGDSGTHDVGGKDVFIDVMIPPPQLVIVSAGDDSRPLARLAAEIGFRVIVADQRPALLTAERFPRAAALIVTRPEHLTDRVEFGHETYAVVMTHNYAHDRDFLRALLATDAVYLGVLGPRSRTDRILSELAATSQVDDKRIYGPIGLDIGTDGAEQVALSALAEILAVRSGREPTSLRERRAPIHVPLKVHVRD